MPLPQGFYPGRQGGRYDRIDNQDPNSEQFCKLFIGGLSYETDEKSLRSHFEQYGEIVDCIVMKDAQTKRSRGFGFITYKKAEQLDEAQKGRPHKLDGREVETKRAMPRDDPSNQQSVKKMFVGGLKDDTTDEMIRETFAGKIEKLDVIKDKNTGKSRGFCFVTFDDADTVDKYVLKRFFQLNGRTVEVKKAVSREEALGFYGPGRGGFGPGDFPCGPGYNMGGGGGFGYRPGPSRGGYGGNYGNHGYGNQGWNQNYPDYGYGNQGGWGGQNYNYGGPGPMKGGYGGGSNYRR
ncbi:heterogeneous nuclear ribonucleoprotein A1-like 3 [Babylonia areolata]|uniref:heterogeneous nuclear ribonucleoprotein A1-like 3 n=1 Tax=Babylonia areolata TaxID=304850 RepID=UPI003FD16466